MDYEDAVKRLAESAARSRQRAMDEPSKWPPTDYVLRDWECSGLRCVVCQGPFALCGYVLVPTDHPDAEKFYDDVDVAVHGGLTFTCRDTTGGRWFGFDTGHSGDMIVIGVTGTVLPGRVWTVEDVAVETEALAKQLVERQRLRGAT